MVDEIPEGLLAALSAAGEPEGGLKVDPLLRPFDEAWVLAGFLDADTVRTHLRGYDALPGAVQQQLVGLFGAAAGMAADPVAGRARFHRVSEPNVLRLLRSLVPELQPATHNLVGFEWVEIAPIIAGQFATGRRPHQEDLPDPANPESLARFCLFAAGEHTGFRLLNSGGRPALVSSAAITAQLVDGTLEGDVVTLRYQLTALPAPIRVMVASGRTIALTGIERLAALHSTGIERALCLVHYGYGIGMLGSLPRVPADVLQGNRPPLVRDLLDPGLATAIPIRAAATICAFQVQTTNLG